MKILNRYDTPNPCGIKCQGGATKQSFKEECDINSIVKKFHKTGQLPNLIQKEPRYGDFSEAGDYHQAMNIVITAREQFEALPSTVRRKFNNNPEQFLEFASDPQNKPEMAKMGLTEALPSKEEKKAPTEQPKEKPISKKAIPADKKIPEGS